MIRVRLPIPLRRHAGGMAVVELPCCTISECLEELERRFPAVAGEMRDGEGRLRSSVHLYINGEDVRYRPSLDTPLEDGDELTIMMPVAGGGAGRANSPATVARPAFAG